MTFTYGLSSELLTPGQSQDGKEGSIQAGRGTEGGTLLVGQAAGPVPAGSSQPGAFPELGALLESVHRAGPISEFKSVQLFVQITKPFPDGCPYRTRDVGRSRELRRDGLHAE